METQNLILPQQIKKSPKVEYKREFNRNIGVEPYLSSTSGENKIVVRISPMSFLESALSALYRRGEILATSTDLSKHYSEGDMKQFNIFRLGNTDDRKNIYFIPYQAASSITEKFKSEEGQNGDIIYQIKDFPTYNYERRIFTKKTAISGRLDSLEAQLRAVIPSKYKNEELKTILKKHEDAHVTQLKRFGGLQSRIDRCKADLKRRYGQTMSYGDKLDEFRKVEAEVYVLTEIQAILAEMNRMGSLLSPVTQLEESSLILNIAKALDLFYQGRKGYDDHGWLKSKLEVAYQVMENKKKGGISGAEFSPHYTAWLVIMLDQDALGTDRLLQMPAGIDSPESLALRLVDRMNSAFTNPKAFIENNFTPEYAKTVDLKLMAALSELERI